MAQETQVAGRSDVRESNDLQSLAQLLKEGILDEQEYALAKARVLQAQRDALLAAAGVSEEERTGWKWSNSGVEAPTTKLAAIEYKDLAQEVCASGVLAAEHVLDVMRSGVGPEQLAQGCSGLSKLAERDASRAEILAKGAVDVICAAMAAHPQDALVQEKACLALSNLAIGPGEVEVRSKGLQLILTAMHTHRASRQVQLKGCRALANCAFSSDGEADVLAQGGVGSTLAAMTAHPDDAQIQEEGADALANLAGGEPGKTEILRAGGLEVLHAANNKHRQIKSIMDTIHSLTAPRPQPHE